MAKISGEQIQTGTIPIDKLTLPNDDSLVLKGDGTWAEVANTGGGAKTLHFGGTLSEAEMMPDITNTMLGLDGKDLTQENILVSAFFKYSSEPTGAAVNIEAVTYIHPDKILWNTGFGAGQYSVTILIGDSEAAGTGGAMPEGESGQTLFHNGTGWKSTSILKIEDDGADSKGITIGIYRTSEYYRNTGGGAVI